MPDYRAIAGKAWSRIADANTAFSVFDLVPWKSVFTVVVGSIPAIWAAMFGAPAWAIPMLALIGIFTVTGSMLFVVTMYEKVRGPLPENKTARDTTQDPDQYKQLDHDNQHLRQALKNATGEVNAATRDRDAALEALEVWLERFAYSKLSWIAEREILNGGADAVINVDVRFATPDDHFLAKKIQDIIEVHTHWPVTLDGGNKPAIEPNNEFKVLFESDLGATFDEIAEAFKLGSLLDDVSVGVRRTGILEDRRRLVVEVTPMVLGVKETMLQT